ncbi:RNA-directed DNA polymerase, eukaryota [Tanacetum coccineum]
MEEKKKEVEEKKIAWVSWSKVLASKSNGGLGVSSFYALNRGLLFKWIWRFLSRDQSLWAQVIHALHGSNTSTLSASYSSLWSSIIKECNALKSQGLDLISHCKIRVGNGMSTSFWHDQWLGDSCLRLSYPRLFALENNKVCSVAAKMSAPFVSSLRRDVRGGEESAQLSRISDLLDTVVLSNMGDRRFWDLNGDGCFRVKDVRRLLDDMLLPKSDVPSRWVKQIPIKVNVLAWKISMDRLPTRVNLHRRGVQVSPISCPICCEALENLDHLLFCCDLAKDIARFNQVQNKCWKECFTLPGGVSGHIETISSSLIQIFEKMCFEKASGLKVNIAKSRLYGVGVSRLDVEVVASSLGCDHGSLPFIYLGLPVGSKMNRVVGWNEVVNRVRVRLSSWKAKALSIGGRLTLIKSVLGSLPLYYFSLFKAPMKILNLLESIRSRFFWGFKDSGRGISWVKWKAILLDKEFGNALWRMVITEFYGPDGGFGVISGGGSAFGGVWINILNAVKRIGDIDISFKKSFILKIGNGYSTSFWKDRWCGDGSRLMDMFPKLFALESFKDCKISDRWHCLDGRWCGNWAWRSPPRGRALDELASLATRIGNLTLYSDGADKWSWAGEASSIFKVKTLSKKIQNLLLNNCLLFYVLPFCESVVEDIDYSLIRCPYVIKLIEYMLKAIEGYAGGVPMFFMGYLEMEEQDCQFLFRC